MKKIIAALLMLPMLANASYSERIYNNKVIPFINDEMFHDIVFNEYFAPPYNESSYKIFSYMNDFCSDLYLEYGLTQSHFDTLTKLQVLAAISGKPSEINKLVVNSGGLSTIKPYLNEDLVSILERSQRTLGNEKNEQLFVSFVKSPMYKKFKAKMDDFTKNTEGKSNLNTTLKICLSAKQYYPYFIEKESKYNGLLWNINRDMRRTNLNGVMNSLHEANKEAKEALKSLDY